MRTTLFLSASLLLAMPGAAFAGANKTWVSGTGADSGTCPITAPCKSFQYAHDQTAAGGEIDVKDAGGYGTLIINKAISILAADGVLATISVPQNGTGVTIDAGSQDKVVLRGLTIDGHGIATSGVLFNTGNSLKIEDCHISNLKTAGLDLEPSNAVRYDISKTDIKNAGTYGVFVQPPSGTLSGTLSNLRVQENFIGIFIGRATAAIIHSTIIGNSYAGVQAGTSGDTVLLGDTTISENAVFGVQVMGGSVNSFGDNSIAGNENNISGPVGSIGKN